MEQTQGGTSAHSLWSHSGWTAAGQVVLTSSAAQLPLFMAWVSQEFYSGLPAPVHCLTWVGFSTRPQGGEGGNTNLKMTYVHSSCTLMHFPIIYL